MKVTDWAQTNEEEPTQHKYKYQGVNVGSEKNHNFVYMEL